jgi:hypothetical protein
MRRTEAAFLALLVLSLFAAIPSRAQTGQAPHAFLFGSWTGGLFPPPSQITAEACLAMPSVIFTRDAVLRASLTDVLYVQRAIETVRGTGKGVDFRFVHAEQGFGCDDPDALQVQRISANQIKFLHCADFPFSLVRCPAR